MLFVRSIAEKLCSFGENLREQASFWRCANFLSTIVYSFSFQQRGRAACFNLRCKYLRKHGPHVQSSLFASKQFVFHVWKIKFCFVFLYEDFYKLVIISCLRSEAHSLPSNVFAALWSIVFLHWFFCYSKSFRPGLLVFSGGAVEG